MAMCLNPTAANPRCRKCNACLKTRLRSWQFRLQLEAMLYDSDQVTFLTLTYKPSCLPDSIDDSKKSIQKFYKRLRKVFNIPGQLRYVCALEQGSQGTHRFHWHAILYGITFSAHNRHILEKTWGNGFIDWKPATPGRMSYILKYVIKGGKFLMSKKPGIGADAIKYLNMTIDALSPGELQKIHDLRDNRYLVAKQFSQYAQRSRTIPAIKSGGYYFPLHDYIKKRLRDLRRKI